MSSLNIKTINSCLPSTIYNAFTSLILAKYSYLQLHLNNKTVENEFSAVLFMKTILLYQSYNLLNLNFCPPIEASYMSPPFCMVNTITPSVYFTFAEAPSVTATAEA